MARRISDICDSFNVPENVEQISCGVINISDETRIILCDKMYTDYNVDGIWKDFRKE